MAIIIEEEKKNGNLLTVLGGAVIVGMILIAVYFIFFVPAPAAIIVPSSSSQGIANIVQPNLSVQGVLQGSEFQSLKTYVVPSSTFGSVAVGRADPFISP